MCLCNILRTHCVAARALKLMVDLCLSLLLVLTGDIAVHWEWFVSFFTCILVFFSIGAFAFAPRIDLTVCICLRIELFTVCTLSCATSSHCQHTITWTTDDHDSTNEMNRDVLWYLVEFILPMILCVNFVSLFYSLSLSPTLFIRSILFSCFLCARARVHTAALVAVAISILFLLHQISFAYICIWMQKKCVIFPVQFVLVANSSSFLLFFFSFFFFVCYSCCWLFGCLPHGQQLYERRCVCSFVRVLSYT